jgi:hypothetical protein
VEALSTDGSVIIAVAVAGQLPDAETETVYVPALSPEILEELPPPGAQKYIKGPTLPTAVAFATPLFTPLQVTFDIVVVAPKIETGIVIEPEALQGPLAVSNTL